MRRSATAARRAYVVDHYRPGRGGDELRQEAERLRDAVVDLGRAGNAITWLSSNVMPDDDYFQSVLEATSERLVREAHALAGVSLERISLAIPICEVNER